MRIKNIFRSAIISAFTLVSVSGCSFLDVDPELGMTDDDVFGVYKNFKAFFATVYSGSKSSCNYNVKLGIPLYIDSSAGLGFALSSTTDETDCGGLKYAQKQFKRGSLTQDVINNFSFALNSANDYRPIAGAMFTILRVANKTIENIDRLANATPEQKNDLLGQAYFIRGYAHFVLVRYFGGMPYIDFVFSGDDEWDMERLSSYETLVRAAADFQKACDLLEKAGKMRRDARPGEAGNLEGAEMFYPNGVAAKAMQARALLYAASPLDNVKGKADWEAAAVAASEAIALAEYWGYYLLDMDHYNDNFYGVQYTNEQIWAWSYGKTTGNENDFRGYFAYPQSENGSAGGLCPTQNFVDRFETKYGDMLYTQADRDAAIALGHYNPQNPYADRDPRFYKDVVFDGMEIPGFVPVVNIYFDPVTGKWPVTSCITTSGNRNVEFGIPWGSRDDNKGASCTGYYCKKWWNGAAGADKLSYYHTDPVIRLAELYLNYAEAAGEAYGPQGSAPGAAYTAEAAVDKVRARASMGSLSGLSQDEFLKRVRNERCVELSFEGHHYYSDIRRWKIAPQTMGEALYGMYIESCAVDASHPNGKAYTYTALPSNRQCVWKGSMYYIPFPDDQARKLVKFENNDSWN